VLRTAIRSIAPAAAIIALALFVTPAASAQQPAAAPAPSAVPMPMPKHDTAMAKCTMPDGKACEMMKMPMDHPCPMMAAMHHPAAPMGLAELAKPETAQQLAAFMKNFYDALIAKGFSKADALKIITEVGVPHVMAPPAMPAGHSPM